MALQQAPSLTNGKAERSGKPAYAVLTANALHKGMKAPKAPPPHFLSNVID
jgi:hypothetical protein